LYDDRRQSGRARPSDKDATERVEQVNEEPGGTAGHEGHDPEARCILLRQMNKAEAAAAAEAEDSQSPKG